MDENILFSYELKDAWFLPIAGVEVYKTGEVRCMTESATSSALAQRMAEALSLSRSISGHSEKKNTATSVHTLPMRRECAFCRFSIR